MWQELMEFLQTTANPDKRLKELEEIAQELKSKGAEKLGVYGVESSLSPTQG
jgi:hypothetical protein